jgi:serine protease Do
MFWKKLGLLAIVLAALGIVAYAQTSTKPRAHSTNLQVAMAPGYLGVGYQELSPERLKALSLKEAGGVEVTQLAEGAAAASAGVHVHDVILEVSGQKIASGQDLVDSIAAKSPGTKITLIIWRDGSKRTLNATLGHQMLPTMPLGAIVPMSPEEFQAMISGDAPRAGFEGEPLTPQLAEFFGVSQGEGVLVRSVGERTPADKAGLRAGDVVIKVNGMPVARFGEIVGIMRQAKKVIFTVIRNKREVTLNVEIARNGNPFEPDAVIAQ